MKRIIYLMLGLITLPLTAQTNTFPTSGNVGIGTATPTQALDVSGNANVSGNFNIGLQQNGIFNFGTKPVEDIHSFILRGNNGIPRAYLAASYSRTQFSLGNINGEEVFNLNTGGLGADNVYIHMPKPDSRIVISGYGDYKPEHKFIVRNGSALFEGDILSTGNVGIGTTTPDEKLAVNGNIHTKEVRVDLIDWSDFVFEEDYNLPSLKEVEQHIKEKGHLKDIPSKEEVKEYGILLGDMNAKLLQKIEELTLYTIQQEKQLKTQETINQELKERLIKVEQLLLTQPLTTKN